MSRRPRRRGSTHAGTARLRSDIDWAEMPEGLNVFVPGLMGAGILLSAVILVSDGVRKLLPNRGVRRRLKVVLAVRRIVVDVAEAAGIDVEERNLVRRERRPAAVYLLVAFVALPLAVLVARWGFNAYSSSGSALEGNAMAIFYGMVGALAVGLPGLVSLWLSMPRLRPPQAVNWLVRRTPFGRLSAPPESVTERARLLIPNLDRSR